MVHFYDLVRSLTTNALLMLLLFTLGRPKCRRQTLWAVLAAAVAADLGLNIFFYLRGDYTTLAMLDIIFFILAGGAIKPLFCETPMQWLFNCFTVMNIYAVTVLLSYYLCDFFPYPTYANTLLRALLFSAAVLLFRRWLRPLYRQAAEHWSSYLFVSAGLFANFAWYFVSADDVEQTLSQSAAPLTLLILLAGLVYISIGLSLQKSLRETALREENLKFQSDRELTRQRLALMEETVGQMSIAQHDRRHFNNTLLALLEQGETESAAALIRRQSAALPLKPRRYCRNVPVNAAVSYYAELARQQGIRCEIALNLPEKLAVDELTLAMAVSNLMENAVAAAAQLPPERRELRFTAVNAGQLILELENPYEGRVSLDENGLPVASRAGHGKGSRSIRCFADQCGGALSYQTEGGMFRVRLMV